MTKKAKSYKEAKAAKAAAHNGAANGTDRERELFATGFQMGMRLGQRLGQVMTHRDQQARLQRAGHKVGLLKEALRAQVEAGLLTAQAFDDRPL